MSEIVHVTLGSNRIQVVLNSVVARGGLAFVIEKYVGNGAQTVFPTNHVMISGSVFIFLNGILLEVGADYTLASNGLSATLASAPDVGWKLEIRYAYLG